MSLVWINGELVDKANAKISVFDHGLLYGDGIWEPMRVFGGKLFRPEEHFLSLVTSAYHPGMELPFSQGELIAAAEKTVAANNRTEGYVRILVTRGLGTLGPDPRKIDPQVVIIAEEYQPFPSEVAESGLHLAVDAVRYGDGEQTIPTSRTLSQSYLVEAKRAGLKRGCLDVVFLNQSDQILGTTEGDILIVMNGELLDSPISDRDVLAGFVIDELAAGIGPHRTKAFTLQDLFNSQEAFLAGTSCGIVPVTQVEGKPIADGKEGPVTRQIRLAYRKQTRGEG